MSVGFLRQTRGNSIVKTRCGPCEWSPNPGENPGTQAMPSSLIGLPRRFPMEKLTDTEPRKSRGKPPCRAKICQSISPCGNRRINKGLRSSSAGIRTPDTRIMISFSHNLSRYGITGYAPSTVPVRTLPAHSVHCCQILAGFSGAEAGRELADRQGGILRAAGGHAGQAAAGSGDDRGRDGGHASVTKPR